MADIALTGVRKDIEVMQGNTSIIEFTLRDVGAGPLDMTGYTVQIQVRSSYESTDWAINLTLANGGIEWVSQSTGVFKANITPAVTTNKSKIRFTSESPDVWEGVYDVEVNSNTDFPGIQKPWYGDFTILREVTRV